MSLCPIELLLVRVVGGVLDDDVAPHLAATSIASCRILVAQAICAGRSILEGGAVGVAEEALKICERVASLAWRSVSAEEYVEEVALERSPCVVHHRGRRRKGSWSGDRKVVGLLRSVLVEAFLERVFGRLLKLERQEGLVIRNLCGPLAFTEIRAAPRYGFNSLTTREMLVRA